MADVSEDVNYIAHLLHDGDSLSPYSVRCEAITQKEDPPVKAKRWGPTTVLALIGCGMSCGLLGLSIHERDGMALLAVIFLSFLSTLVGFGCQWKLELPHRRAKRQVPPADVVINYPNGSFLIIKCNENVARALYWHPEECIYFRNTREYRLISLLGTLVLMFGVIFLGNARIKSQLGFAASYIILNAAYWIVAALPQRWNWDLRCYDAKTEHHSSREENETFTTALWKAIAISGTTKWVRNSPGLAPATEKWNLWLKEAQRVIDATPCEQDKNTRDFIFPRWDPEKYLTDVLGSEDTTIPDKTEASEDSMV
ncbi:MAG: hypothetical protein LQ346_001938 [Caloplaca aetnensis]|nr:MAG: hypothetical protein LQ346_001938 [Caloplaca aetnensis]